MEQDPDQVDMEKGDNHPSLEDNSKGSKSVTRKITVRILVICLVLLSTPLAIACLVTAATLLVSLLIVPLLVARLNQFIRRGESLNDAIQLVYVIKSWISLCIEAFLLSTALLFPIAKYTPGLKHVMVAGFPLTKWIIMVCMISGFFAFGYHVSIYSHLFLPRVRLEHNDSGMSVPESVSEIINCLIIWWAESEVKKRVPAFEKHQMLGLHSSQWIKVSLFTLIGYNCITLSTRGLVWSLQEACRALDTPTARSTRSTGKSVALAKLLHIKHVVYCANGMRRSINFILSSVMLLLIWVLYFGSHLDGTPEAKRAIYIGTQTSISLLICSLLWLLKTSTVLAWEARKVYSRLEYSKTLELGKQLHFHQLLGCPGYLDDYDEQEDDNEPEKQPTKKFTWSSFFALVIPTPELEVKEYDDDDQWPNKQDTLIMKWYKLTRIVFTRRLKRVQDDFCKPKSWKPTMDDIQQVAQYVLKAKYSLQYDKSASIILRCLRSRNPTMKIKYLKDFVDLGNDLNDVAHDWKYFVKMVREVNNNVAADNDLGARGVHNINRPDVDSSEEIRIKHIQIWEKMTRRNCLFLANTLSGDKEMVDCLNKIISMVIIGATFIIWLILTKLASIQVFVLIGSPLLAASFIFGDTCKSLFQGIMFVYVVHPFDVGDKCDIGEDHEMRVVSIGVWKTTFSMDENGSEVEVVYPNSELAKKRVINHKIKFDWLAKQK